MASKTRPMAILLLGVLVSCYAGADRQTGGVAIVELPPGGVVAVKPMMPFAFDAMGLRRMRGRSKSDLTARSTAPRRGCR